VTSGQERNQRKVDDAFLAENDRGRGLAHFLDLSADLLDAIDELGLGGGECCHGFSFAQSWI
jgi:hypothetical protein